MIWGPFLLALALGLVVSAGLYFAYMWPDPDADEPGGAESATEEPPPSAPSPREPDADPAPSEPSAA